MQVCGRLFPSEYNIFMEFFSLLFIPNLCLVSLKQQWLPEWLAKHYVSFAAGKVFNSYTSFCLESMLCGYVHRGCPLLSVSSSANYLWYKPPLCHDRLHLSPLSWHTPVVPLLMAYSNCPPFHGILKQH